MNVLAKYGAIMLALGATGAIAKTGDELVGNSLEAARSDGARAVMQLGQGGALHMIAAPTDAIPMEVDGTYSLADGKLCFTVEGMGSDCWRYTAPLAMDKPTKLDATTGSDTAIFTLRTGKTAQLPPEGE